MSISGVGGPRPADDAEPADATQAPAQAEADAPVVRGGGTRVPEAVSKEALSFDQTHHASRNIPDLSYGPVVVGGEKAPGGGWIVQVGSMPTSIIGPRPGAKPFDVASYLVKDGKVTNAGGPGGTPGPLTPTGGTTTGPTGRPGPLHPPVPSAGALADRVIGALKDGDDAAATKVALQAGTGLSSPGLGFPRLTANPASEDVKRFQDFLGKVESNGSLSDLAAAVGREQTAERDRITGGEPHPMPIPDWYGSADIMSMLVSKYGSDSQKEAWASPTQA
jgi:hypothetical protein